MKHQGQHQALFIVSGMALGAVAAGIIVGQTIIASTYLPPTANPPQGNIPSTIWNRIDLAGAQQKVAIQIDGGGPAEDPIGTDTNIPIGMSVGGSVLNLGPTHGGQNIYYGIGDYNMMSADSIDGYDYLMLMQTYDSTGPSYDNRLSLDRDGNMILSGDLEVSGEIDVTGCFGSTFVGMTTNRYNGDLNGAVNNGYYSADALCEAAFPGGGHVCSVEEMLSSIKCAAELPTEPIKDPAYGTTEDGSAWINGGAPGYTSSANDCNGWQTGIGYDGATGASYYGRIWNFDAVNGGIGFLTTCNSSVKFACCK